MKSKIKKSSEGRMSKFSFCFTKIKIYLPVFSILILVLFIFSVYLNEFILFILDQRISIPFMKENIKKETLQLKLGIFNVLENENLIFTTQIIFSLVFFFLFIFLYSFFKTIFLDPGYLPDPVNFEYNLILQNLEIKEEHEFISYEETETSNLNNTSNFTGIVDSGSNITNCNNEIFENNKTKLIQNKSYEENHILKYEIFDNYNFNKKTSGTRINENQKNYDIIYENEILLNNFELNNNKFNYDSNVLPSINVKQNQISSNNNNKEKNLKINNLYEENQQVLELNIGIENDLIENVDYSKITTSSNLNNSSHENHKYNNNSIISMKEDEFIKNISKNKNEINFQDNLVEENTLLTFNNLNNEYFKERNDFNMNIIGNKCNIYNIPASDDLFKIKNTDKGDIKEMKISGHLSVKKQNIKQSTNTKSSKNEHIKKNFFSQIINKKNHFENNSIKNREKNFFLYNPQENDSRFISPISGNITENSSLSKIKRKKLTKNFKKLKHIKGKSKIFKFSKKKNYSLRFRKYFKNNLTNITDINDPFASHRKYGLNENKIHDAKITLNCGNLIDESAEKNGENISITSSTIENIFSKILKMRNNFIKDFGKIVFNGPICTSEGVKYRNYLEKYLNFNNVNTSTTYSNSYFHSILYNQSIIF